MKTLLFAIAIFSSSVAFAQKGKIYGSKPNGAEIIEASKLDAFIGTKTRVTTTIRGVVVKVTKPRGGWFTIEAGNGRLITAHFAKYGINLPANLAGHTVVVDGIAERQFIADDSQHLAGEANHHGNNSKDIAFEVNGLQIEK